MVLVGKVSTGIKYIQSIKHALIAFYVSLHNFWLSFDFQKSRGIFSAYDCKLIYVNLS